MLFLKVYIIIQYLTTTFIENISLSYLWSYSQKSVSLACHQNGETTSLALSEARCKNHPAHNPSKITCFKMFSPTDYKNKI